MLGANTIRSTRSITFTTHRRQIPAITLMGETWIDILMDIDYEHWKLLLWGESVGLINHTDSTRYNKRLDKPNVRKLMYDQLFRLKRTFDDVEKFKEKYGIQHEQGQLTSMSTPPASLDIDTYRDNIKQRMLSRQQQASLCNKAWWAFRGKTKLTNLATDLKHLNERLHYLVPVGDDLFEERILEGVEAIILRRNLQQRPGTSQSFGGRSRGTDGMEVRSIVSTSSSSLSQTFYSVRSRISSTFSNLSTSTRSSTDITTDMDDAHASPIPDGPESQSPVAEGEKLRTKKEPSTILSRWTHVSRFTVLINLAQAYIGFERPDDAAAIYEHVVIGQKRVLGEFHIDILQPMESLASIYLKQGKLDEAGALFMDILEIKKLSGEENQNILSPMYGPANYYREQKRHDDAAALFKNIIEIKKKLDGEDHPNTLSAMYDLANYYREQKRHNDAAALFKNIIEMKNKLDGEDHPNMLSEMHDLAEYYREQERHDDAAALFKNILEIKKKVYGEGNPNTILTMYGLAINYREQKRLYDAEALLRNILRIQKKYGLRDRVIPRTMRELAIIYREYNRFDKAEENFKDWLGIAEILFDKNDQDISSLSATLNMDENRKYWRSKELRPGESRR
ncbi:hypothetical protein RUND412_004568 [Rhizina undulata]